MKAEVDRSKRNDPEIADLVSYELEIHVLYRKIPFGRFRYTLSKKGVRVELVSKSLKTLNRVGTIVGFIMGNPGLAGAGMISTGRETAYVNWKSITKTIFNEKGKKIALKNGWFTVMDIYCTDENYNQVADYVKSRTERSPTPQSRRESGEPQELK
jgi:hypothetical protein